MRGYELFARDNRELSFVRAVRRPGGESEFARLREYTKDDEYRSIDWRATARRQKLVAREYQLESNQNVLFALDAGRMMTAESQGLSQFDHALNASLMLAHVASRTGDQVGLVGFADRIRAFVRPQGGKGATATLAPATSVPTHEVVSTSPSFARRRRTRARRRSAMRHTVANSFRCPMERRAE